jgi:hypothetical protein
MGEAKRREKLNKKSWSPSSSKPNLKKIKIGEIAPLIHQKHGRGFFVNIIGKPLVFLKGTPHLNEIDSSIVEGINLSKEYVLVDFPNGIESGFSALMTCGMDDKTQFRISFPQDKTIEEIANNIPVFD